MSTAATTYNRYILNATNSGRAIEKGLAEADWYASPVPKAEMRKLLERRDGPAIRDTLLWFGLLIGLPAARVSCCGAPGGRSSRSSSTASSTPPPPTRAGTNPATARPSRPTG